MANSLATAESSSLGKEKTDKPEEMMPLGTESRVQPQAPQGALGRPLPHQGCLHPAQQRLVRPQHLHEDPLRRLNLLVPLPGA
ncbi:hypothetical protein MC885_015557 [Smutsia gigantea]|nr:hypothetical protein MC885_015557 [Smutsia gigantea]